MEAHKEKKYRSSSLFPGVEDMGCKSLEIHGVGCSKYKRLKTLTEQAVEELGIDCRIVKVKNLEKMLRAGVQLTPALIVDGEIKSQGKVPSYEEILGFLST